VTAGCVQNAAHLLECRDGWGRSDGGGRWRRYGGGDGLPSMISLTLYSIFTIGGEGVETGSREG